MTPKVASKPKRRDWAALDRQHQRRGTLAFTLLLNPDVLTPPVRKVGRGRPQRYTDAFVEALLMMQHTPGGCYTTDSYLLGEMPI